MNPLTNALNRLEARLQDLVEGAAAHLFPNGLAPFRLVPALLAALENSLQESPTGGLQAPNEYVLFLHPEEVSRLNQQPAFLEELATLVLQACRETGIALAGPLAVRLERDPTAPPGGVQVLARHSLQDMTPTAGIPVEVGEPDPPRPAAYLIVDGVRLFPIEQAVVNIGRRPDNHLVIDDPRVSRLHAQLRFVRGQFIIFDLDSTGGTWVNGQRVRQQALRSGDVISLAGLPLVFNLDHPPTEDTQQMSINET